jgi:hypothetical protein
MKLRPIVSTVSAPMEILAVFIDCKLQEVVQHCTGCLKDGWELLKDLKAIGELPANARLIAIDAVRMHSNIDTKHVIDSMSNWFKPHEQDTGPDFPMEFMLKGLRLIMDNNFFKLGDTWFHQNKGSAMGTSPACAFATAHCSCHEETRICK